MHYSVVVSIVYLLLNCADDNDAQVHLIGDDVTLQCQSDSTQSFLQFTWRDHVAETPVTILIVGSVGELDKSEDRKYQNFEFDNSGFPSSMELLIRNVQLEDQLGPYSCSPSLVGAPQQDYDIQVEDIPQSLAVTCEPDEACPSDTLAPTKSSQFTCTCTAVAAYPDSLTLEWTGAVESIRASPAASGSRAGYFDITGQATFTPTESKNTITCTVIGYSNTVPVESRSKTYTFAPPTCTIAVDQISSECTTVNLLCDCSNGHGVPDTNSYLFHDGTQFQEEASNRTTTDIEPDAQNYYSCRGCNGVGYGTEPGNITTNDVCIPSTTAAPNTNTVTTDPPRVSEGPGCNTGLIIGIVVAAILVLVAVIIHVGYRYFMMRERDQLKGNVQSSNVMSLEKTCSDNSAYMDLEERARTDERRDLLGEIPEANVEIVSDFPSSGCMVYRKVNIIRNSRREQAVAKSPSEDVPIAFLKLWNAEIKSVLNLPKQRNIVGIIGWCNAVPSVVLTELVTGENLLQHLSDNFSSHKLHQYGNIKKKTFQVHERGNRDILPKYALDISRGLQFLLINKFIHPGLRAEKVLVDSAGTCKLYDIVPMELADQVTSLLWRESVPYQWVSLEYLLLGTMRPAGDVWSFGVLLWELFSYGSQPYPGEDRDAVENSLRRSDRLPMPQNCPGAIWQLMIQCWEQSPERRPKLGEITSKLSAMCHENKEYEEIQNQRPLV